MNICYIYSDASDAKLLEKVTKLFSEKGINLIPFDGEIPCGICIVFFSKINQSLEDLLQRLSFGGAERILGIYLLTTSLPAREVWKLCHMGISDIILWEEGNPLTLDKIFHRLRRWQEIDELIQSPLVKNNIIGNSKAWLKILRQIVEVARFTKANILLLGESGTGKEEIAKLVHSLDSRDKKGCLVIVDCTTIVPELAGSEFFGHERGAFTGAINSRDGAFALAKGGTLFLDEVGELPLTLQAQLLRVVQEGTFKRVGGNSWYKTEFRLICATNKNLLEEIKAGRFRYDLYYRIANWVFTLPPLRDRFDDIIPLAEHFMQQCKPDLSIILDEAVKEFLLSREYPGNIRELKQLIERIMHKHIGSGPITAGDIPEDERPKSSTAEKTIYQEYLTKAIKLAINSGFGIRDIRKMVDDIAMNLALDEEKGNLRKAAQRLGLTERALQIRRANENKKNT